MTAIDVFARYEASLVAGDMAALAEVLSPDARWNQPGSNPLSGVHEGRDKILALLGEFMRLSSGSFRLGTLTAMENGDTVAATVEFSAQREGREPLGQRGVDIFRVEGEHIVEVWLFSEDQAAEDVFWA